MRRNRKEGKGVEEADGDKTSLKSCDTILVF